MIPEFPEFASVSLELRAEVMEYIHRDPPAVSEMAFTNMFAWRRTYPVEVSRRGDALYVLAHGSEDRVFSCPPVGAPDAAEAAREMCGYLRGRDQEPLLMRLPRGMAEHLADDGFQTEEDRPNWDYVYRVVDLAELTGRNYEKKRNRINKCLAEHECAYLTLTPDLFDEVLHLQTEWCDLRNCEFSPGLVSEDLAIREGLEHYEALELLGGVVFADGRLAAFTIGEAMSPRTAVVHFEKADPSVDGLYQLVNQQFCEHELKAFEFVNREQDLGNEGLRRAKKSYHPHHMVEKYIARPGPGMV